MLLVCKWLYLNKLHLMLHTGGRFKFNRMPFEPYNELVKIVMTNSSQLEPSPPIVFPASRLDTKRETSSLASMMLVTGLYDSIPSGLLWKRVFQQLSWLIDQ